MSRVSNIFPDVSGLGYKIAIIVSHPSVLQAPAFYLLKTCLQQNKVLTNGCFYGFISQFNPEGDTFNFDMNSFEVKSSLENLETDLKQYSPNVVLYVGEHCLRAIGIYHSILSYRGSMFKDKFGYKALSTFEPAQVHRNWDWSPLLSFDIQRLVAQSESPELKLPVRQLRAVMSGQDCIDELDAIQPGTFVSIDIEGGIPNPRATKPEYRFPNGVTCVGISTNKNQAFIIPLKDFDLPTKVRVLKSFARVMCDPAFPKVLQNGLYDFTVLCWVFKLPIRNIAWDTMISGWEIYPELPKSLATQTSIYTEEPFYKSDRKVDDDLTHYRYCCKDASVTLEIAEKHAELMTVQQIEHFKFNMSLLPALQFMMLKGIKYDKQASDEHRARLMSEMNELQHSANLHAGQEININSSKQMCELLYKKLGLPPQYAKEHGRNTTRLTANADAMLKLIVKYGDNAPPFLLTALLWKKLEGARKQLEIDLDGDGRVRCRYNLVGTETGRLSCQESNTGSGTNLQTIMEYNRKFYIPDEGHYFFQCDLSGADGWTVAVHCAELGDSTMLDDYNYGLKPAKIIAAMSEHGQHINTLSRAELKAFIKSCNIPDETYAASKAVQHGSNYGMRPNRMSENILEKSFKKSSDHRIVWIPPAFCGKLQTLYFLRYPGVRLWQKHIERQIDRTSTLPSASGHVRTFFGRPRDPATYRLAYAHEPQANTTYATNLAMQALWKDPANRTHDNSLIIQPLHSVHDALCGQFPIDRAGFATEQIQSYFSRPIKISNTYITIPFEGGYGPSWYHTKEGNSIGKI